MLFLYFQEAFLGQTNLCGEIVFEVEANFDSYQKLFFLDQFSPDPRSKTNTTNLYWTWPHWQEKHRTNSNTKCQSKEWVENPKSLDMCR